MNDFSIAGQAIDARHPPSLIAPISANPGGKLDSALRLIEAAKEAGASAVKLQTYTADTMTIRSDAEDFQIRRGLWQGRQLYDLYEEAHTPWTWHHDLFAKGRELGITVIITPFDRTSVDFLESLGAPAYKIASFELVDLKLIGHVAATGKPMIISTGMASLGEIQEAVDCARAGGCRQLALLHCVSGYPSPAGDANLGTMAHLAQAFDVTVGLSDHTLGIGVAVAPIGLGARLIEKHFIMRRSDGGPDSSFSMEPPELAALVREGNLAWQAVGHVSYAVEPSEQENRIFRRSLYVVADIKAGERFTPENVRAIRPGHGLAPKHIDRVLGAVARRDLQRGTALDWTAVGEAKA